MSLKNPFPYEIEELPENLKELLKPLITGNQECVKLKGTQLLCSPRIKEFGEILYNFKPKPDDVWLIGFPRCGTTLLQEILYLLGTDLNYEKAASQIMDLRFPYIEKALVEARNEWMPLYPHEQLERTTERRFIKSHMGLQLLHPELLNIGCKVVFALRNPMDAVNSAAHYPLQPTLPQFKESLVWKLFLNDMLFFGNYFGLLEEAWRNRHNENVLVVYYEDVVKDKKAAILKIADFLGKKLDDDQLAKLLEHVQIENFKSNRSLNNDHKVDSGEYCKNEEYSFIRRGKVGDWKAGIPENMVDEVKTYVAKKLDAIDGFVVPESWRGIMEL